jgi:hypothetical protein
MARVFLFVGKARVTSGGWRMPVPVPFFDTIFFVGGLTLKAAHHRPGRRSHLPEPR